MQMAVRNGEVHLCYRAIPEHNGYRGWVHGGIAMTLMDEVMTWAAILATRSICVAGEMTVRFITPMPVGRDYWIKGRITKADRRLVWAEAEVETVAGQVNARAAGKYVPRPGGHIALSAADFDEPPPPELAWLDQS